MRYLSATFLDGSNFAISVAKIGLVRDIELLVTTTEIDNLGAGHSEAVRIWGVKIGNFNKVWNWDENLKICEWVREILCECRETVVMVSGEKLLTS